MASSRAWVNFAANGAGGTASVTRRIGRWRTAWMVLSGADVDATTAAGWGLVDTVAGSDA